MDTKQREVNKRILDRIASDPTFREELLNDPRGAMERAGFKWEGGSEDEVSGYGLLFSTALNCGGGPPPTPSTAIVCGPGPGPDPISYGGGGQVSTAITCTPDPSPKPKPVGDPGTGTVPPPSTTT